MIRSARIDFSRVKDWASYVGEAGADADAARSMHEEATGFLAFHDWCSAIAESFVGLLYSGIVAVFLFRIIPSRDGVDEWLWVVVGDLPPAYLTVEDCPSPAAALDGYIGAMQEWVAAALAGASVAGLIPVNALATRENGESLQARLRFLDDKILSRHRGDSANSGRKDDP